MIRRVEPIYKICQIRKRQEREKPPLKNNKKKCHQKKNLENKR